MEWVTTALYCNCSVPNSAMTPDQPSLHITHTNPLTASSPSISAHNATVPTTKSTPADCPTTQRCAWFDTPAYQPPPITPSPHATTRAVPVASSHLNWTLISPEYNGSLIP